MTDPETADVTYIEPLNVERLEQITQKKDQMHYYQTLEDNRVLIYARN